MATKSWNDSVMIARPIESVWKVVADPTTAPSWIKGVTKIELSAPGAPSVGSRFRATRTVDGRTSTEEIRVTECSAPSRYAVEAGVMKGGIELRISYTLRSSGAGTNVDMHTEASPKSFGARFMFGMFWSAVVRNDAENLKRLKTVVEEAAPVPG